MSEGKGNLVLARKTGQRVTIGADVTVTVLEVKGGTIRLGIQAPQSVRILRTELLDQPEKQGQVQTRLMRAA